MIKTPETELAISRYHCLVKEYETNPKATIKKKVTAAREIVINTPGLYETKLAKHLARVKKTNATGGGYTGDDALSLFEALTLVNIVLPASF